jgi:hypothetical protein
MTSNTTRSFPYERARVPGSLLFGDPVRRIARVLCLVLVLGGCSNSQIFAGSYGRGDGMAQSPQFKVPETVWYGETPYSPDVPKAAGLVFRAVQAVSKSGPTVALAAAYRLGTPFLEYYGGQLPRPVWVVAVDVETGRVYHADLNGPDHPPIRLETSDKAAEAAMPGTSSESARFNMDLAALLGLPEQAGGYRVFLWLDDLMSPVETVQVPANPARGTGRRVAPQPPQLVQFWPDPAAPKAEPGRIVLASSADPADLSAHGAWVPPKFAGPHRFVLWLLAASHRERRVGWVAVRAGELPGNVAAAVFSFQAKDLLKSSGIAQKVFVVALSPESVSNVLIIRVR